MSIGSRIKELRERKNISRNDFATIIGVTVGAISNYENDVSSPKEPILFKIIEALDCDANYLFQDVVKIKTTKNDVNIFEYDMVKKYRVLDLHGKEMVNFVLEKEYDRSQIQNKTNNVVQMIVKESTEPITDAANPRDDIEATDEMREHDNAFFDED